MPNRCSPPTPGRTRSTLTADGRWPSRYRRLVRGTDRWDRDDPQGSRGSGPGLSRHAATGQALRIGPPAVPDPYGPGDRVCWRLTVTGNHLYGNEYAVQDFLPDGFTYESWSYGENNTAVESQHRIRRFECGWRLPQMVARRNDDDNEPGRGLRGHRLHDHRRPDRERARRPAQQPDEVRWPEHQGEAYQFRDDADAVWGQPVRRHRQTGGPIRSCRAATRSVSPSPLRTRAMSRRSTSKSGISFTRWSRLPHRLLAAESGRTSAAPARDPQTESSGRSPRSPPAAGSADSDVLRCAILQISRRWRDLYQSARGDDSSRRPKPTPAQASRFAYIPATTSTRDRTVAQYRSGSGRGDIHHRGADGREDQGHVGSQSPRKHAESAMPQSARGSITP